MTRLATRRLRKCASWLGALLLSGCATYHPLPLPVAPDLATAPTLSVPSTEFQLPGLKPHPFPANGLDETAIMTLAVFDNPDLKATRLEENIASAQLLGARLLPDPVVSLGVARSALNVGGDVGLAEDLLALRTRGAAEASARAHQQQVHLEILWQEYQVAEKARELFIEARTDSELMRVFTASHDLLARRSREDNAALQRGDVTLTTTANDLARLTQAETNLQQVELDANQTRHTLNQLLGLKPDVSLPLIGPLKDNSLTAAQFHSAVAALPHRRADLLALKAGYEAQEENLRRAILAQFPAINAGVTMTRDPVEGVNAFGPNVSLTLPIFNRNRGPIAVEKATRAALRQAYQARLDQAVGDADQVWQAIGILRKQLLDLDTHVSSLRRTASAARQSVRRDNLTASVYINIESSYLSRQAEVIRLRASLESAQAALRTLLGLPFGSS